MTNTVRCATIIAMTILMSPSDSTSGSTPPSQPVQRDQPYAVEYYYKTKWGFADEFIRLFKKNHYPVLKKQVETGRMLSVNAVRPRYHTTEDGRWDYRVTIVFKSLAAAHDSDTEQTMIKQLYPDQDTFKREEQHRFEILIAHWDVPLVTVDLDK
jgi:hypothetical protein